MVEIWLSGLTVVMLLIVLRLLKNSGGGSQNTADEERLQTLITEFDQENKELVRSIAQLKRTTDLELTGVKEELKTLQEQVKALTRQNEQLRQSLSSLQYHHQAGLSSGVMFSGSTSIPVFLKDDYKDIPDLYVQGMSSHDIARKLGIGNGEVEMVLQMLKKQGFLS
ncbi:MULTISPECIES: DUF6115 domain-containing protein [Aneurinibacillus]|uniref:Uncharacterized protein n=1 Tax=Aneurinibacillus thermoaerophilus TaxID=143495 RepID=A0A1G7WFN6_ANETH|nr:MULTISPECIES: hypothetical protein [Aneurinibacillus]AMA72695.1 hypothetical protein ACH33_07405 [Aneurinibacillus sp. XH2]MED0674585.1 hypothetical protein [Aneurinibacillus thermoaerophilus]MED0677954.1 hypothetical protein [Aneurinibacillus thermoaerophilus]MED0736983.1 hypothetical protein [Aneurinibacillus thermoaerophilus]MED0756824.1 hypothetical protein [Aneurinibacillus thermoaerophilus]